MWRKREEPKTAQVSSLLYPGSILLSPSPFSSPFWSLASAAVRSLKLCSHRFLRLKTELYASFSAVNISCDLNWWRARHPSHYPAQRDSFLIWTSHVHLYCLFSAIYRGLKPDGAALITQLVKNLPALQETLVQFLGQEDPLEKGMATHSSIHTWRILWPEEPGGLLFIWSQRVWLDWVTSNQPKQTMNRIN